MHRFWTLFSGPIVETVKPRRILQIGPESGLNAHNILNYARRNGVQADIIESDGISPEFSKLDSPDIVFLADCRNWRATLNEATQIFTRARDVDAAEPILLANNCAWPYARRDMYSTAEASSPDRRHPCAYKGVLPGQSALSDHGLNAHLANALHEGGVENGVLTAIENFIASWPTPISLTVLPFFNGMAIAVPERRRTPELDTLLKDFFKGETMLEALKAAEEQTMRIIAEGQQREAILVRRTEALRRARDLLAAQSARIAALEDEIARLKAKP